MNTKRDLGQIFYGRGPDGYGILGVSPAGRPFVGAVASLCRTVGSPDRSGDMSVFLLGKREGAAAIMIRACRGAPDPAGRATVLFHALVADAEALRSAGLDAFAFADDGTFASVCPTREPPDLVFPDIRKPQTGQSAVRTLDLPATISSDRPLDALVRRELGEESLDRNWATFTYNPLPDFDLCVLSSYSPRKGEGTQYAFDGAGLHRLSPGTKSGKKVVTAALDGHNQPKRSSWSLFVSLAVNVLLLLALLARGGKGEVGKPVETPPVVEMTESDARAKWEDQWKSEWEKSQAPEPVMLEMSESDARAKWEAQWKFEWEQKLPIPFAKTENEAMEKCEATVKEKWAKEFNETIRASGGEWPMALDDDKSPFLLTIRSADVKPEADEAAAAWTLYKSCKVCAEFIQNHFNP